MQRLEWTDLKLSSIVVVLTLLGYDTTELQELDQSANGSFTLSETGIITITIKTHHGNKLDCYHYHPVTNGL